jgi:hypothetical protein
VKVTGFIAVMLYSSPWRVWEPWRILWRGVSVPGVPAAGAGLDVHSDPKSGHETPEKYTPRTIAKITKQQHTRAPIIMTGLGIYINLEINSL